MVKFANNCERARKGDIDLLFQGDSITEGWMVDGKGKDIWNARYGKRRAASFGIAGDATERFDVTIKSRVADRVRFEFFAVTGKTYTLERSTDLKTWTSVPFSAGAAVPAQGVALPAGEKSYTATGVGITQAACLPGADLNKELYRLTVR